MIEHDGKKIPTADPKDPDSIGVEYGFTYPLEDLEVITSSVWLINGTVVSDGGSVDGLVLESSGFQNNITKAGLSGGNAGTRYVLTNRLSTNVTPLDDRSMYIKVVSKL